MSGIPATVYRAAGRSPAGAAARVCAAWTAPSISSNARWSCTARPSTCAMRSSTTGTSSKTCVAKGAIFIDELRRRAGRGHRGVFRAWRIQGRARGSRTARPAGLRCHMSLVTKVHVEVARMRAAGREIVMIGHKAPSGSRRHAGPVHGRHVSGRDGRRRPGPARHRPGTTGLRHADDAVGG